MWSFCLGWWKKFWRWTAVTVAQWCEYTSVQFSLVAQSCPTLCDPNCILENCQNSKLYVIHALPQLFKFKKKKKSEKYPNLPTKGMLWGEVHNGCFIWLWRKGDKYTHITRLQRPQAKQFSYHLPSASSHLVLSSNTSFQISSEGKNSIQQIIIYFVIHILLKFYTLGDRKEKQKLFQIWALFQVSRRIKVERRKTKMKWFLLR